MNPSRETRRFSALRRRMIAAVAVRAASLCKMKVTGRRRVEVEPWEEELATVVISR
jgi:hypothetical protein